MLHARAHAGKQGGLGGKTTVLLMPDRDLFTVLCTRPFEITSCDRGRIKTARVVTEIPTSGAGPFGSELRAQIPGMMSDKFTFGFRCHNIARDLRRWGGRCCLDYFGRDEPERNLVLFEVGGPWGMEQLPLRARRVGKLPMLAARTLGLQVSPLELCGARGLASLSPCSIRRDRLESGEEN